MFRFFRSAAEGAFIGGGLAVLGNMLMNGGSMVGASKEATDLALKLIFGALILGGTLNVVKEVVSPPGMTMQSFVELFR